jgi:hypothetical protein
MVVPYGCQDFTTFMQIQIMKPHLQHQIEALIMWLTTNSKQQYKRKSKPIDEIDQRQRH